MPHERLVQEGHVLNGFLAAQTCSWEVMADYGSNKCLEKFLTRLQELAIVACARMRVLIWDVWAHALH